MKAPASRTEEIANAVTHGVGAGIFAAGAALLVTMAALRGDARHVVACSVYAATLVLFYTISTLYHAVRGPRVKRVFRILDHAAIYLLIAGTYTPFVLVTLRGAWGWSLFGLVWGLAVLGIVFKSLWTGRLPVLSTALYVVMGWCIVVAWKPLVAALPPGGVAWLVAGGLVYSAGVVFYALDRSFHWAHPVWHVFVLAASACHFIAVLLYVVPPRA
ncbi:MAG: PAQR family membrane homeostasis protein TrhA [Acidithiobacillales bacterium]